VGSLGTRRNGCQGTAVDDSYYRERLADVVRLLYQEAGGRIRRNMTREDCTHDDD